MRQPANGGGRQRSVLRVAQVHGGVIQQPEIGPMRPGIRAFHAPVILEADRLFQILDAVDQLFNPEYGHDQNLYACADGGSMSKAFSVIDTME